jgi:hypothetical protein
MRFIAGIITRTIRRYITSEASFSDACGTGKGVGVIIVIFIITTAVLIALYGICRRASSKWCVFYADGSCFCELRIDGNQAELEMDFLYQEDKTRKSATFAAHFRDSLLFYDRDRKKYFRIEDFKHNAKWFQADKADKPSAPNRFFAENWNGRTIEAFINRDDLTCEKFGARENPVRIFKLKYGGSEYLSEKYRENLAAYKRSFVRTKFQTLEAIAAAFQFIWIVTFFAALNWLFHHG